MNVQNCKYMKINKKQKLCYMSFVFLEAIIFYREITAIIVIFFIIFIDF